MTSKIINGIDVSECCCFENGFCLWIKKYYETGITPKCRQVKDCYFKQLKRLEQENKKLKEVTNEAIIEHENLLINRNDFAERAEKYRQALEEIREITNEYITYCMGSKCEGMEEIQNKINEVLNDRD